MAIKLGDKAPDFSLKGVDGKIYSLDSFSNYEILVIIISCNHCPYVVAYEDRLIDIQRDYSNKGVRLAAINPNNEMTHSEDSFENMVIRSAKKGFNFPYLRDASQEIPKLLGAQYTPEVYAFDKNRKLRYHGRIDDNYGNPAAVSRHDLRDALDSIVSGRGVQYPDTTAIGCTIKWK
ncbi:MAG: thioredoxin family protein [Nitrospirae bacterium]|nr:thioredoxin family protein [Nitrospirota bacterium]